MGKTVENERKQEKLKKQAKKIKIRRRRHVHRKHFDIPLAHNLVQDCSMVVDDWMTQLHFDQIAILTQEFQPDVEESIAPASADPLPTPTDGPLNNEQLNLAPAAFCFGQEEEEDDE